MQIAALQEHGGPDTGAVAGGKPLYTAYVEKSHTSDVLVLGAAENILLDSVGKSYVKS